MPAMASVTVKKADGTTDIVYDALTGSAGDASKAVWRQDTGANAAVPVGHRATLEVRTFDNGPKTARKAEYVFKMPYSTQNTTTSRYEAKDTCVGSTNLTMPKEIPPAVLAEFVHQYCNLLYSTLMKSVGTTGYAPRG